MRKRHAVNMSDVAHEIFADAHRNLGTYMFNNYIYISLFTKGDDIIITYNDNHMCHFTYLEFELHQID